MKTNILEDKNKYQKTQGLGRERVHYGEDQIRPAVSPDVDAEGTRLHATQQVVDTQASQATRGGFVNVLFAVAEGRVALQSLFGLVALSVL